MTDSTKSHWTTDVLGVATVIAIILIGLLAACAKTDPHVWPCSYPTGIHDENAIQGALLTHVPVHPNSIERFGVNIHGHLHHEVIDDPRYVCVSCERVNLTPVAWETIKSGLGQKH